MKQQGQRGDRAVLPLLSVGKGANDGEDGDADVARRNFKVTKLGTTDAMGIKALGQALKDHGYLPLEHEEGIPLTTSRPYRGIVAEHIRQVPPRR